MTEELNSMTSKNEREKFFSVGTVDVLDEVATAPEDIIIIDGDRVSESFAGILAHIVKVRSDGCRKGLVLVFGTKEKLGRVIEDEAEILSLQSGIDAFISEERPELLERRKTLAVHMVAQRMRHTFQRHPETSIEKPDGEKAGCKIWEARRRVVVNGRSLVHLSPKLFTLLCTLVHSRAQHVTYDELEALLATSDDKDKKKGAVRSLVKKLNKALSDFGVVVKNVPGHMGGYHLLNKETSKEPR